MKKEWFEEWFDSPYYHLLYKERDEAEAKRALNHLLMALGLPHGALVLDLACGKGRHARYLAEKGFQVTGLDISEKSIAFARQFESPMLEFYQHDMRKPFRANYYDGVLNMFTSFGYFKTDREHQLALRSMTNNLKVGGLFLLDFFNSHWVQQTMIASEVKEMEGIMFYISKKIESGQVFKTIDFEAEGRKFTFTEAVRLFTLEDFQALFTSCQLKIRRIFGGYDLSTFDPESSRRLILVAEKTMD